MYSRKSWSTSQRCVLPYRPDGGITHLWNVCKFIWDYTVQYPRSLPPSTYISVPIITQPLSQTFKESSSSFPVLGLLRPVTGVTKLNPSIYSKVFLHFFSFLVDILESFLGSCQISSCQHALSNFSHTDIRILLSVRFVILLKYLHFFCDPNGCIPQFSSGNAFLLILIFSHQFLLSMLRFHQHGKRETPRNVDLVTGWRYVINFTPQ
jgi:hypothetical protein